MSDVAELDDLMTPEEYEEYCEGQPDDDDGA